MRKALLVLGANSPKCFDRLVSYCDREDYSFFVHVDAKRDLEEYTGELGAKTRDRAQFVTSRYEVFWGGFNMIRATVALLEASLQDGCEHFTLLSDDSFWLRSPEEYADACLDTPNRIDHWRIGPDHQNYRRYENFFYFDGPAFSPRFVETEKRTVSYGEISQIQEDLLILRELGKAPVELRMGSQWWGLERRVVETVLGSVRSNRHLDRSFKYSAIPDEMYFQTLSAPAIDQVKSSPMLVDFAREPKPFVFRSMEDIDLNVVADRFFVRKVDPSASFIEELAAKFKGSLQ